MSLRIRQRQDAIRSRRAKKHQARQARLRRQVIRFVLLSALLSAGISIFTHVPWTIQDCDRDIIVQSNRVVSDKQVKALLSDCKGIPLYRLDPQELEDRVESLAAVKHAFVRRYLRPAPHLVVVVLEEFPFASFARSPDMAPEAVIGESGRFIPISQFPAIYQPPLRIYGPRNLKFSGKEVAQWANWCSLIQIQTGQAVEFIDLRKADDVQVKDGALTLKLGSADSSLTRRLSRLSSLLPHLEEFADKLSYIDLSLDNNVPLKLHSKAERAHRSN